MNREYSPRGIPLIPDTTVLRNKALTTIARACLYKIHNAGKSCVARNHWSDDRDLELVLRGAVTPTSTTNNPLAAIITAFVKALTPVSAAASVIDRSLKLSLDQIGTLNVPGLSLPTVKWVGEGHAIPVQQGVTAPLPQLQLYKLATILLITRELASSGSAESMMRQLLVENCGPSLDAAMFSTSAGVAGVQPPGLLNGVAALTASTAASNFDAMIADVGAVAQSLGPASGGSTPIIVAAPGQAASLKLFAPNSELEVFSSNALAAGTVVGVVPQGVATVVEVPIIDTSTEVSVQAQDVPTDELLSTGVVFSVFQSDQIALRLILPATWARRSPFAVAWVTSVKW
jgi:hypothetical protein